MPSLASILEDSKFEPDRVERIAFRKVEAPVEIIAANPDWPNRFSALRDCILAALGKTAISVNHVGSTSVPGLPAKDIIDIDLIVADLDDEASYVPQLEAEGYHFLLREPHWHGHRFLCTYPPQATNLHVWGPDSPEAERHRIFRDRLLSNDEDRKMYLQAKEAAAQETRATGGATLDYNERKEEIIRKILRNAFKDLGYLQ